MSDEEQQEKVPTPWIAGCSSGCSGLLAALLLPIGLWYTFGHPFCIDAPCTDTATVGPFIIFLGALAAFFTFKGIRYVQRRNEERRGTK